jgi:hypothetical protein
VALIRNFIASSTAYGVRAPSPSQSNAVQCRGTQNCAATFSYTPAGTERAHTRFPLSVQLRCLYLPHHIYALNAPDLHHKVFFCQGVIHNAVAWRGSRPPGETNEAPRKMDPSTTEHEVHERVGPTNCLGCKGSLGLPIGGRDAGALQEGSSIDVPWCSTETPLRGKAL